MRPEGPPRVGLQPPSSTVSYMNSHDEGMEERIVRRSEKAGVLDRSQPETGGDDREAGDASQELERLGALSWEGERELEFVSLAATRSRTPHSGSSSARGRGPRSARPHAFGRRLRRRVDGSKGPGGANGGTWHT